MSSRTAPGEQLNSTMDRTEHLLYLTADVELSIEVHEANLPAVFCCWPELGIGLCAS